MNFLVIGGFLGSGKTSFLLQLARYMVEKRGIKKVVLLENEVGEVGVDDKVLKGAGYQVKNMFAGCVCCTLSGSLPLTIQEIQAHLNPDWIIMETTGMAFPLEIKKNLLNSIEQPSKICCLVDARRWLRLVAHLDNILQHQLEEAAIILINKSDLVDAKTLEDVRASISSFNPDATCHAVSSTSGIAPEILEQILGGEPI